MRRWYPIPNYLLMKLDVPSISNFPLFIIAMRSANSSASSRWWVVRSIVLFSFFNCFRMDQTPRRDKGSRPEVGSSRKRISEPPIRAHASEIFLLLPPLNSFTNLPNSPSIFVFCAIMSICSYNSSSFSPFILPKNLRWSIA